MDLTIQFCYDKSLDQAFINKLFSFLITRGAKYNAGKYKGSYFIIPAGLVKGIEHTEDVIKDSTEKIAEIIDEYLQYDLQTTSLGISLEYFGEVNFDFRIYVIPEGDKSLISFETIDREVANENAFLSFVNLCKDVFEKFNLSYGVYKDEYHDYISLNDSDLPIEASSIINFYSKSLVDKIGRETLLSTSAQVIEELENGGLMIIKKEPEWFDD